MTIEGINIWGTHEATDDWKPPTIDGMAIAYRAKKELNICQRGTWLYVFRTEPYIDTLFIRFDETLYPNRSNDLLSGKGTIGILRMNCFFISIVFEPEPVSYRAALLTGYTQSIQKSIRNGT